MSGGIGSNRSNWNGLDVNGDGVVEPDEYDRAVQQAYNEVSPSSLARAHQTPLVSRARAGSSSPPRRTQRGTGQLDMAALGPGALQAVVNEVLRSAPSGQRTSSGAVDEMMAGGRSEQRGSSGQAQHSNSQTQPQHGISQIQPRANGQSHQGHGQPQPGRANHAQPHSAHAEPHSGAVQQPHASEEQWSSTPDISKPRTAAGQGGGANEHQLHAANRKLK